MASLLKVEALVLAVGIAVLLALVVGESRAPAAAGVSRQAAPAGVVSATAKRACIGWKVRAWRNRDGMNETYRFTPVFRRGWPSRPYTSATVWWNGNYSAYPFSQRGRHVDVSGWYSWRMTRLMVWVSSGEHVLGGKVYRCRNHRYR